MGDNGFELEPAEFGDFVALMARQYSHLQRASTYAYTTCGDTTGLDRGLISVVQGVVERVADANSAVYREAVVGSWDTALNVISARQAYERADEDAAANIEASFGEVPGYLPSLDYQGTPSQHGYDDGFTPELEVPPESDDSIAIEVDGTLGQLDWLWEQVFGESLLEQIVEPITGNYGRLKWLATAYQNLGDATYRVAWNMRTGTRTLAASWHGDASSAFQLAMFQWHMGLGGLGDVQHLISDGLEWAHGQVESGVNTIVGKINTLVEKAERFLPAGRAKGVFESVIDLDPRGVLEQLNPMELYNDVRGLWDDVQEIRDKIDEVRDAVDDAKEDIEAALENLQLLTRAAGALGSVRDEVESYVEEQLGSYFTTFERSDDHNSLLGAPRVLLLPVSLSSSDLEAGTPITPPAVPVPGDPSLTG